MKSKKNPSHAVFVALDKLLAAAGKPVAGLPTAFNPAVPEDHSLIEAEPLRDQFNSLKALVDDRATHDEVIEARNDAIAVAEANCASECDSVELLQFNANMSYDEYQMQQVIFKINELINALKG